MVELSETNGNDMNGDERGIKGKMRDNKKRLREGPGFTYRCMGLLATTY